MHETLAAILIGLIFLGLAMAVNYIWVLTRFFKELRRKEPELWRDIGSPSLANMLFLPFMRFRKFYAFLPILKARRYDGGYNYASRAIILLYTGLAYCVVVICFVMFLVVYVML